MLHHPKTLKRLSTHSGRLERWLGAERLEQLSNNFRNGGGPGVPWYGPPVNLSDVPGSVWIGGDGDFTGDLGRGFLASAADSMADHLRRLWRKAGKPLYLREPQLGAGFASVADYILKARTGYKQLLNGNIAKTGPASTTAAASTLWQVGALPVAGISPGNAPGGRVPVKSDQGAIWFNNPSAGTLHLTGADFSCNVINNALMLYDRIFDVAKNKTVTTTQAVTGVPTRYQSTVATDPDYAGGNFLFAEVRFTLSATAHNFTVCLYTDEAGNAGATLPSFAGRSGALDMTFDMALNTWFAPLATGDIGMQALTQMQMSATLAAGNIDFVMAHPLGVMMFPQINDLIPFDWVTVREHAPRIFDNACLALFEFPKPSGTATTYNGFIEVVNAP